MMKHNDPVTDGHFEQPRAPNPYWWEHLFSTIDACDAAGFVDFLSPDAEFRFGNAPAVQGSDAIAAAVTGFFGSIRSSRHQLGKSWHTDELAGCEGTVTYTRHDGSVVSYPFANVFHLHGEKISSYRIYVDASTLFIAPT